MLHCGDDNKSIFEIFSVINLPIPYLEVDGKEGVMARYKLEAKNTAFNGARTRFILLTPEEARVCEANGLGACPILKLSLC